MIPLLEGTSAEVDLLTGLMPSSNGVEALDAGRLLPLEALPISTGVEAPLLAPTDL